MKWLFNSTDTGLDQAALTLDPFISAALGGLDDDGREETKRMRLLSECYIYGAIRYLASYDNMKNPITGDLLKMMFARHFNEDSNGVDNIINIFSNIENGCNEQLFMVEGASALRRWLVNGDRAVANDLKRLLVSSN